AVLQSVARPGRTRAAAWRRLTPPVEPPGTQNPAFQLQLKFGPTLFRMQSGSACVASREALAAYSAVLETQAWLRTERVSASWFEAVLQSVVRPGRTRAAAWRRLTPPVEPPGTQNAPFQLQLKFGPTLFRMQSGSAFVASREAAGDIQRCSGNAGLASDRTSQCQLVRGCAAI